MIEKTLCVIKPNAVAENKIGVITKRFEDEGLRIVAVRMTSLSREQTELFYAEHRLKSFFGKLVDFMTSGPICAFVLEGKNAISRCREIMGATDPSKAAPGTIRALYGTSVTENAVHGSDSPESAEREISFYFSGFDIF